LQGDRRKDRAGKPDQPPRMVGGQRLAPGIGKIEQIDRLADA
jgi:hypothetical protein